MSQDPQKHYEYRSRFLHKTEDYRCTPMIEYLKQTGLPHKKPLIEKLEVCAQFHRYGLHSEKIPNFCNLRYLCDDCTKRKTLGDAMRYSNKIMKLMIRYQLYPLNMTLKPTSGRDLVQQLLLLDGYLKKIRQQRSNFYNHGKGFTEFCRSQYALVMIEVTRAKEDTSLWRPHVHAIVLNPISDTLFDLPALANEWTTISGLTIRPEVKPTTAGDLFEESIRSQSQITLATQGAIHNDLKKQIMYPFKLSSDNQPPLCPEDKIAVYSAMFRRHRIREWTMPKTQRLIPSSKV